MLRKYQNTLLYKCGTHLVEFLSLCFSKKVFWYSIVCVLFYIRWLYRLKNATLWAEDGSLFVADAYNQGIQSLLIPYSGYFHTIPRMVSYALSFLPSIFVLHGIMFICLILTFYVLSTILKQEYEWLIPSIKYRGVLFVLLSLAIGTNEVYGNLANLHWVLYVYVGLMGMRNMEYAYSFGELIFIFFCVLSQATTIVLLPLFLARLYYHLKFKHNRTLCVQEIFISAIFVLMFILNYTIRVESTNTNFYEHFRLLSNVFIKMLCNRFIAAPWFGNILYTDHPYFYYLFAIILGGILVIVLRKKILCLSKDFIILFFFLVAFLLFPPIITMARKNLGVEYLFLQGWVGSNRYQFNIGVAGLIFWVWILSLLSMKMPKIAYSLCLMLVFCSVLLCDNYLMIQPAKEVNYWIKNASLIDMVRKNANTYQITIPIQPEGWSVTIGKGSTLVPTKKE